MVTHVPIVAPRLAPDQIHRHWPAAIAAAVIVASFAVAVLVFTRRRGADANLAVAMGVRDRPSADGPTSPPDEGQWPGPLGWQRVPRRILGATSAVSAALALAALLGGFAPWVVALGALLPWGPALAWEGAWKYRRYGFFAIFYAIVLFQLAHMGEHTVQVLQLLATHGDLARSHGVFGQLDFELVHFLFDGGVWLALGALVVVSRGENRWLWIAFAVASLHEVEHLYLFWLSIAHPAFYAQGGFAGIMGSGGLVGSPLARPYLHFAYNFIEIVPMVMALLDVASRVARRRSPVASPPRHLWEA
jgi:hypothetical protein